MLFATPLVPGRLVQRYKRFLADVVLDTGEAITAHCANPGAMLGLNAPGAALAQLEKCLRGQKAGGQIAAGRRSPVPALTSRRSRKADLSQQQKKNERGKRPERSDRQHNGEPSSCGCLRLAMSNRQLLKSAVCRLCLT